MIFVISSHGNISMRRGKLKYVAAGAFTVYNWYYHQLTRKISFYGEFWRMQWHRILKSFGSCFRNT